eukprot:CAMPEP_0185041368 /NCGR_PEP_ID=MMETSP1103-20130426/40582_1 /TAXON_ID=36769 /ORGANISM="Paraphysomonas bandaiensis, Strain Caron Lab Isolate" /LENGTH=467 /DNA_ID=CAMNT_0027581071 /DNA_START=263 /DNA_END=1666 /DNA_ORIENTATION=-
MAFAALTLLSIPVLLMYYHNLEFKKLEAHRTRSNGMTINMLYRRYLGEKKHNQSIEGSTTVDNVGNSGYPTGIHATAVNVSNQRMATILESLGMQDSIRKLSDSEESRGEVGGKSCAMIDDSDSEFTTIRSNSRILKEGSAISSDNSDGKDADNELANVLCAPIPRKCLPGSCEQIPAVVRHNSEDNGMKVSVDYATQSKEVPIDLSLIRSTAEVRVHELLGMKMLERMNAARTEDCNDKTRFDISDDSDEDDTGSEHDENVDVLRSQAADRRLTTIYATIRLRAKLMKTLQRVRDRRLHSERDEHQQVDKAEGNERARIAAVKKRFVMATAMRDTSREYRQISAHRHLEERIKNKTGRKKIVPGYVGLARSENLPRLHDLSAGAPKGATTKQAVEMYANSDVLLGIKKNMVKRLNANEMRTRVSMHEGEYEARERLAKRREKKKKATKEREGIISSAEVAAVYTKC